MIKVEVIEDLTLGKFSEIENLKRKGGKDKKGWLFTGDKFECEKKLADYLLGDNPKKATVVKVIEVEPKTPKTKKTTKKNDKK